MTLISLVSVLGLGCGGGGEDLADASLDGAAAPDAVVAQPDAPPPDPHGPVHIEATTLDYDGAPEVGATVVFIDADGTRTAVTDAEGRASGTILPDATVVLVRETSPDEIALTVILAVQPRDVLRFGSPPFDTTPRGTMPVRHGTHVGASTYEAQNGCSQADSVGGVAALPFNGMCGADPQNILVSALNPAREVLAWAVVRDVAFADGAPVQAPAFQRSEAFVATLRNAPPMVNRATVQRWPTLGGRDYYTPAVDAPIEDNNVRVARTRFANFTDRMLVWVVVGESSPSRGAQLFALRTASAPAFEVDLATRLLPWVSEIRFDRATSTVSWTESGREPYDSVIAEVTYDVANPEGGEPIDIDWVVVAPPGTTSVVLPTLPAELGDLAPPLDESLGVRVDIELSERSSRVGYADARLVAELDHEMFAIPFTPAERERASIAEAVLQTK